MADLRLAASTSNIVRFTLKNKTTGQGLTGLTGSTSGLIISTICDNESSATAYTQAASHIQTIATPGTFSAPSASNCRFGEVDSTNHKGLYEFQFADARFAVSNAKRLIISVNDAESTILDADYEIQLVQFNPYDAVHLGLSAIPNTAVTTNASLLTSGTGTDQLSVTSGRVDVGKALGNAITTTTNGIPDVNVKNINNVAAATPGASGGLLISGSNSGTTTLGALTVTGATTLTGAVSLGSTLGVTGTTTLAAVTTTGTVTLNALTVTNATTLTGAVSLGSTLGVTGVATFTAGIVANITGNLIGTVSTLTTYTGNTPQTGDSFARIGATGSGLTSLAPSATALSTATWTSARAGYLDNLNIGGAVASHADAVALDVDILTRLAASSYTAPDNADIAAIKIKTDHLPDSDIVNTSGKLWVLDGSGNAVAPASDSSAIKAKTDNLPAAPASTTNITAGTITTVTNLTNAPTAGDFTAAMKTSLNAATPAVTVSDKTGFSLVSTGLNLVLVDGKTLPAALQYIAASVAGQVSGAGTGTEVFLGLDSSTTRLTISADSSGNRTAVVYG